MNPAHRNIINLLANQALWFIGITGGDFWAFGSGMFYAIIYCRFIGNIINEWRSVMLIVMIGFTTDLLLSQMGIIHFSSDLLWPVWLLVLWISFATLMHHGLQWLQNHLWIAVLAGLLFGPLSYYAGAHLGDSVIAAPLAVFMVIYGLVWAMFMPLFLRLARRF